MNTEPQWCECGHKPNGHMNGTGPCDMESCLRPEPCYCLKYIEETNPKAIEHRKFMDEQDKKWAARGGPHEGWDG